MDVVNVGAVERTIVEPVPVTVQFTIWLLLLEHNGAALAGIGVPLI
jgi:hypothetical protein